MRSRGRKRVDRREQDCNPSRSGQFQFIFVGDLRLLSVEGRTVAHIACKDQLGQYSANGPRCVRSSPPRRLHAGGLEWRCFARSCWTSRNKNGPASLRSHFPSGAMSGQQGRNATRQERCQCGRIRHPNVKTTSRARRSWSRQEGTRPSSPEPGDARHQHHAPSHPLLSWRSALIGSRAAAQASSRHWAPRRAPNIALGQVIAPCWSRVGPSTSI